MGHRADRRGPCLPDSTRLIIDPKGGIMFASVTTLHVTPRQVIVTPLRFFPERWIYHAVGWPLVLAGFLLLAWSVRTMYRAGVDPAPHEATTAIVVTGPYALSRNSHHSLQASLHYLLRTFGSPRCCREGCDEPAGYKGRQRS